MDSLNSGAAALPQQPNLRFVFDYHLCHRVRDVFSALRKTNTSENEHLYLYRDDDLLPVGLLNCPTYHSHSSRTCHNIPRNFSINFHGNWVAFLVLEILCSLTPIVSEMNKSLFCIQGKRYSKCNTLFSYFIFLLNQKTFHFLNLPSAQLNKSIIFASTMPSYWIHSCNFQIWLSAKIRDIASVLSCSSQGFSLLNPRTWQSIKAFQVPVNKRADASSQRGQAGNKGLEWTSQDSLCFPWPPLTNHCWNTSSICQAIY